MAPTKPNPIVGIIGGMGPMATCDLFHKIVQCTAAERDQEHVHLIIDNNTNIPDRSAHIVGHGISPVPEIEKAIAKLIADGAEVLAMPCNTAHYYYDQLLSFARTLREDIRFVHMIQETARWCKEQNYKRVVLLATHGTYVSGLYKTHFEAHQIEVLYPTTVEREAIMSAIYAYKCGTVANTAFYPDLLSRAKANGVSAVVLGCTELPLVVPSIDNSLPTVDPNAILAEVIARLIT